MNILISFDLVIYNRKKPIVASGIITYRTFREVCQALGGDDGSGESDAYRDGGCVLHFE